MKKIISIISIASIVIILHCITVFADEVVFDTTSVGTVQPSSYVTVSLPGKADGNYDLKITADGSTIGSGTVSLTDGTGSTTLSIKQGIHDAVITVAQGGNTVYSANQTLYVMEQYTPQFMDVLSERGVNGHFVRTAYRNNAAKLMEYVNAAGFKVLRDTPEWISFEPSAGNYKYNMFDHISSYLGKDKLRLYGGALYGTTVYKCEDGITDDDPANTGRKCMPKTQESIYAYAEYAKNQYKNFAEPYGGDEIEIWNEPNMGGFNKSSYTMSTEEGLSSYVDLTKATSAYLRRNGLTDVELVGLEMANVTDGLGYDGHTKICFDEGIYSYIDTISFHPYNSGSKDFSSDSALYKYKWYDTYRDILSSYGGWKKVSLTETGGSRTSISDDILKDNDVKCMVMADAYGYDKFLLYQLFDEEKDDIDPEQNFGLIDNDLNPKAPYLAITRLNIETNGAVYLGELPLSSGKSHCYVYAKDGNAIAVAWTEETSYLKQILYLSGEKVDVYDVYGNLSEEDTSTVTLSSSPVYIKGLSQDKMIEAVKNTVSAENNAWLNSFGSNVSGAANTFTSIESALTSSANASAIKTAFNSYVSLGNTIINSSADVKTKSQMLYELYDAMRSLNGLYAVLFDGTATLDSSYVSAKADADAYIEKVYSKPYSDAILKFAGDYYDKAETVSELAEQNVMKNGIVQAWSDMGAALTGWYNNLSMQESKINLGLIAQAAFYNKRPADSFNSRIKLNLNNLSKEDFNGEVKCYINDSLSETREISIPSGDHIEAKFLLNYELYTEADNVLKIEFVNNQGEVVSYSVTPLNPQQGIAAPPDGGVYKETQFINITGQLDAESIQNKDVTLAIFDGEDNLTYVSQAVADDEGKYRFQFKYTGNTEDVRVALNSGGVLINDTIIEALTYNKVVTSTLDWEQEGDMIKAVADITNYYRAIDSGLIIVAYYDENGVLIDCVSDLTTLTENESTLNFETKYNTDAASVKVMLWSNFDTIRPLNIQ